MKLKKLAEELAFLIGKLGLRKNKIKGTTKIGILK
jgi:hypothetical protein